RLVNATLVSEGYAQAATYPPDVRYADLFRQLQADARAAGKGLWDAACENETPAAASASAAAAATGSALCDSSGSSAPEIKGNIRGRTGEKRYHVLGGAF